jgi:hypothetical protein
VGPGLCLVAEEREFRCFTAAGVERGTAVARTSAATVLGIVPDGIGRVTIQGDGPPVGAEVVDNLYEARLDAPAGRPLRLGFGRSVDDGCRRTVAPELLAEVALLRDRAQPGYELPRSAGDALRHRRLDAVVAEGARYWGGGGSVDFWAVPVVPRGRAECAPAARACVVAVPEHAQAAAQCARRGGPDWRLGQLREHAVIFGTVPDGVTGVRVEHHGATVDVPAHDNVFGGVLPFGYRAKDRPRVRLLRGDATVKPRVGIVDAGGLVGDVVGRLQARGYETLGEITPAVRFQPVTSVYWWPGRAARGDALRLAHAVAASGVVPIADTKRVPRPVLDTHAPVVVVVGER